MRLFILTLATVITGAAHANGVEKVYRAAIESPQEIKRAGGFFPRGMDGSRPNQPPPNINLWNHTHGAGTGMARHDSGYVSTTTSRGFAISWVSDHLNHNGYVYHIRTTPNFIDVNLTLRNYSPHAEELEQAALGIIHWNQVIGWERVRGTDVSEFVANPDYRGGLYRSMTGSGAQFQLAGFPVGHAAWNIEPWRDSTNCKKNFQV
ncbi:heat-labile enterotoxin subunit alpha [Enterobacter cancerogenus]|uniref:Heat-labile enterotoxin subunit alpha n=1 Tax=Enterobacter cancerogenus TaxID=69218 RepID=A0AB38NXY2_9ENTR|nr:enterotoxin A family protein [Enterobacter cancerogenus]TKK12433.1 heat-labile enterotoxin subunit alpha [Enterobacter cancerogenus]